MCQASAEAIALRYVYEGVQTCVAYVNRMFVPADRDGGGGGLVRSAGQVPVGRSRPDDSAQVEKVKESVAMAFRRSPSPAIDLIEWYNLEG